MPLESESTMYLQEMLDSIEKGWQGLFIWEDELDADSWFGALVDIVVDVLSLGDRISDVAETSTRQWIICRMVIARYAGSVAAMRRGFDPRACPRCGGDHLDFDFDVEPGLACDDS